MSSAAAIPSIAVAVTRLAHGRDLPLPAPATTGAVGLDLVAAVEQSVTLQPGARALIPTGFALALPPGHEAQIRPRSGLALEHGVTVLNAPGTLDSDYRGEVGVILINLGDAPYTVERGSRIAQLVLSPTLRPSWQPVAELPQSPRGAGGFGSTGTGRA